VTHQPTGEFTMSFATFIFMFFAQYPNDCLSYEGDRFGIKGEICRTTASYRALDSRAFQCVDGVTVKNENGSVLSVYQCEGCQQLVIYAGTGQPSANALDGEVVLIHQHQQIVTKSKILYVETR